jgi:metal-responsive CopG/Arc/MetJ family transcriptional regulator
MCNNVVEYYVVKKVIQIPLDEELLKNLNSLSKKQRKARAEIIRQACSRYLRQVENEDLDRIYQQGYKRIPEQSEAGEGQIAVSGEILSEESW